MVCVNVNCSGLRKASQFNTTGVAQTASLQKSSLKLSNVLLSSAICRLMTHRARQSIDKSFTLRNYSVGSYGKAHPQKKVSLSTWLIVCNDRMITRFLVQAEKLKKAAFKF